MNPFELSTEDEPFLASSSVEHTKSVSKRPGVPFLLIVICLIAAQFLPWIQLRIPGRELDYVSLYNFRGGSSFVISFFFFLSVGLLLWLARIGVGVGLVAIAVGFVGWFAVLVNVSLSVLKGIIPPIGVGNIDLGRGLIGVGPGAILAIAALLLVAMELLPRKGSSSTNPKSLDGFGVFGFLIGAALAMTHTAVWVSGRSSIYESELRLSGDSLLGSFILSAFIWSTAIVGVLVALRTSKRGHKVLSIVLVVTGIIKFFHALLFLVGKGIINLLLPGSVGDVAEVRSHWPLWFTLALSLSCVAIGFGSFVSSKFRTKIVRIASFEFLPSITLVVATCVTIISINVQENRFEASKESNTSSTETSVDSTAVSNSTIATVGDAASADFISRSVVLVAMADSTGEICWSGSGVAVLDGTFILTNSHVVNPEDGDDPSCNNLSIGLTDDPSNEPTRYIENMSIVSDDSKLDLALLKMPIDSAVSLRPLVVLENRLKIDAKIRIIGYPGVGGDTITLNEGVISGTDRRSGTDFYKVSAQISPGNSGGPMVDSAGNLVGIATAYVPADVKCENRDRCFAEGANLGLVRPIGLATAVLAVK